MRTPRWFTRAAPLVAVLALSLASAGACADDGEQVPAGGTEAPSSSTSSSSSSTTTTAGSSSGGGYGY
jgi:hypothetical protein